MALRAEVAAAVELIMTHSVTMKAGRPVAYVIVRERFIVLGQGQVRGVRGAWVVRDVESGRERRALRPEVVYEGIDLGNGGSQTELGTGSKEGSVEMDIAALEEGKESAYFLVVRNVFYKGNEGVSHGHVVGVGFTNETNRRLGVDGAV